GTNQQLSPYPSQPNSDPNWGSVMPSSSAQVQSSNQQLVGSWQANDLVRIFLLTNFNPEDVGATTSYPDPTMNLACQPGQVCKIEMNLSNSVIGNNMTLQQAMANNQAIELRNTILRMNFYDSLVGRVTSGGDV